jgi:hypothetical protein
MHWSETCISPTACICTFDITARDGKVELLRGSSGRKGTAVPGLECPDKGRPLGMPASRFRQSESRASGDGRNGWMTPFLRSLSFFECSATVETGPKQTGPHPLGYRLSLSSTLPAWRRNPAIGEPRLFSGPKSRRPGKGQNLLMGRACRGSLQLDTGQASHRSPGSHCPSTHRTASSRVRLSYPSLTNGSGTVRLTCNAPCPRSTVNESTNVQAPFPRLLADH